MTREQADTIRVGDRVLYRGEPRTVAAIRSQGIWALHFRLLGVGDGYTSYRLCGFVAQQEG